MTPVCAQPGCNKPLPPAAIRYGDPFCSATCARKHWGTELPVHRQGSHMVAGTK